MSKLCLNCNNEEATFKDGLGFLPCGSCTTRAARFPKPTIPVEFTTSQIKESRIVHEAETIQPFRDGIVSQEYLDQYGTKGIAINETELANAKYTWNDTKFYKEHK